MEKEEMIKAIYEKIAEERNVGNEIDGDFYINDVMIGDVLDYLENQDGNKGLRNSGGLDEVYWVYDETLFDKWEEKRKPIEEQFLDCITYVYNLIK